MSEKKEKEKEKEMDFRVVVGLDFGTTYSGFTYCHAFDKESMNTNDQWPGEMAQLKTNTVLEYDENLKDVKSWGNPALSKRPSRKKERNKRGSIVELFKLHFNLQAELREKLPVDYKKAVADYLREIGILIKETVETTWSGIDILNNVLFVLTVPAEYSDGAIATMRECVYNAGLIEDKDSKNLQFTTEPEAAAIYCMDKNLKEHDSTAKETTFMIVDCGGGTVDLTTRKLLDRKQLGEITERAGDYCGSTFIDKEFIKHLEKIFGKSAINLLKENHYGQLQYMIQEFCENAKLPFTGEDPNFSYEIDLDDVCPVLLQYASEEMQEKLEEDEGLLKFDFNTIKSMFDPVIERIIKMIQVQIDNSRGKCSKISVMFLVGGFSQSRYLQKIIKEKFQDHIDDISVPTNPIAAISRGAAIYGLNLIHSADKKNNTKNVIGSRVLKFTYGIDVLRPMMYGDSLERGVMSILGPSVLAFRCIAKRGTVVKTDDEFIVNGLRPCHPYQTESKFKIYYTREYEPEFSDGMKSLGKLKFDWSNSLKYGLDRSVTFKLSFGQTEIAATAVNDRNGQNFQTSFEINTESEATENEFTESGITEYVDDVDE